MNQDLPPAMPSQKTSGLAITSLVLGISVIFMCCITGLPAVIFGIFGLKQIGKNPGMEGKGMAIAGIILGGLSLIFLPIGAALVIPAFHGAMEKKDQIMDVAHGVMLETALKTYAENHDGKYPDSLEVLLEDKTQMGGMVEKALYKDGTHEIKWILTPGLTTESSGDTVLLRSKESKGMGTQASHIIVKVSGEAKIVRDDSGE